MHQILYRAVAVPGAGEVDGIVTNFALLRRVPIAGYAILGMRKV